MDLSGVVVSEGYSLVAVHRLLIMVASLIVTHRLPAHRPPPSPNPLLGESRGAEAWLTPPTLQEQQGAEARAGVLR